MSKVGDIADVVMVADVQHLNLSMLIEPAVVTDVIVGIDHDRAGVRVELLVPLHLAGPPQMVPQADKHRFTKLSLKYRGTPCDFSVA